MKRHQHRSSGCRKIRYPDELSARLVLATVKLRRGRSQPDRKTEQRAYLCARCYGWHLTSLEEMPGAS